MKKLLFFTAILLFCSCSNSNKKKNIKEEKNTKSKLFTEKKSEVTNLHFKNTVVETEFEKYSNYPFIYNGSGVAVGDINNDGLADIYFAGNTSEDKLYVNDGNLTFTDISESSGINKFNGWSTGVVMVDINSDGWLDIYVCRSGPSKDILKRTNRLFINNQDETFTESASEYGLASEKYSIQSAFFDYDLDGDLDMYLLNHPAKKRESSLTFFKHQENVKNGITTTDVFYENINGTYIIKTKEANLFNYGYRHGIAIGDINKDGYPDIFISSDFDDPDLLYINQKNKTFINTVNESFKHISFNSMGNELTDINNDQLLDLFVVDMAPSDHFRSKAYMMSMNVIKFRNMVNNGLHHQYMFNTYQINSGKNTFSEIGQLSGIAKTDWSWAPLFFDMDQDGFKDVFITNGIKENFLYRDIKVDAEAKYGKNYKLNQQEYLDIVPSDITENLFYKNVDGISFKNESSKWAIPSMYNSNGVATADFDNDGDLDFVVNNMETEAVLYENNASNGMGGNSIKVILKGNQLNTQALGSKIEIITDKIKQYQELYTSRGYLSSVDTPLIFGLGKEEKASIHITWPDGKTSTLDNVAANNTYTLLYSEAIMKENKIKRTPVLLSKLENTPINYKHIEDHFDDYKEQILLPHSQSNVGPSIIKGDVNGDGLEDVYIGGAKGQAGTLFIQRTNGTFTEKKGDWINHKIAEDTGALFFDYDNDGDLDLYVVSGGAHYKEGYKYYLDRIYVNDGKGNFSYRQNLLPNIKISGKTVIASDIDNDGDLDLFVGGRNIPNKYPQAPKSYLLINEGNSFKPKEISVNQMVSSAVFSDYDGDGDQDLLTVGEWSSIILFTNENGNFTKINLPKFENLTGLWFSIKEKDIDHDGDMDYFVGNLGLNSKFKANKKKQFHIYADDFDKNGTYDIVLSSNYKGKLVPSRGRECSSQQMPFIEDKFTDFKSFANASLDDIYGDELDNALHYEAKILSSIFLKNNGNGSFEIVQLPWQTQISPTTDFEFVDLDGDKKEEIIAVGNLYNVEVETQRYDASRGAILKFENNAFRGLNNYDTGFYTSGDARDILVIDADQKKLLLVANNNGPLDIFEIIN